MHDSGTGGPDEIEPGTHAFVVKIWREEGSRAGRDSDWRGQITHVASGKRRYVTSIGQLDRVLVYYLAALRVRLPWYWRMWWWWWSRRRQG